MYILHLVINIKFDYIFLFQKYSICEDIYIFKEKNML